MKPNVQCILPKQVDWPLDHLFSAISIQIYSHGCGDIQLLWISLGIVISINSMRRPNALKIINLIWIENISWGTNAKCLLIYHICGWILKMSLDINCSVLYREYCCGIDRMIFYRQILYYNYNVLYNAYGCSGIVWQRNYNTIWNKIRKIWEKEMRGQ